MNLHWERNGNLWHKLFGLKTIDISACGVYVIWHGEGKVEDSILYVGQGEVANRLSSHQIDSRFLKFANLDPYVTWAQVPATDRNGVETYLYEHLGPTKVNERWPPYLDGSIEVNLPWD